MDGDKAPKKRKPPVRRNPDVRREQSRVAARKYREKRKQKLQLLDQLLDGANNGGEEETSASSAATSSAEPGMAPPESSSGAFVNPSVLSSIPSLPLVQADAAVLTSFPMTISQGSPPLVGNQTSSTMPDGSVLAILDTIRHLSASQKAELMQHLQSQMPQAVSTELVPRNPLSYDTSNWVSMRRHPGRAQTRLQQEARRFAEFVNKYASGQVNPAQLSRIYAAESGFFGAIFANCYALGMADVEPIMVDEGASIFCLGPDLGHDPSQLPVVRTGFKNLTPDLQPCDIQITFGHHPYLDVLPWKTFRQKALEAIQQDPPLVNEEELCRDMCTGGLICWGAQQNSMGMEAGVPWDKRSWEPTVWFLKKYISLVGGWNDDMWKSVRWWHNARGERLIL